MGGWVEPPPGAINADLDLEPTGQSLQHITELLSGGQVVGQVLT